jgi:AhpD family alkylhydroperoxidase
MEARMKNPAALLPGAYEAIMALNAAVAKGGVSAEVLHLTHLRVSQINGCAACIDGGVVLAKRAGETDQRLHAVAAWREAPYFTEAECAALALCEAMTRLSDRPDPVADEIWDRARRCFDDRTLAALVLHVAETNLFNRLNVTTHQPAGSWAP